MRLVGSSALVTGGAQGIGLGIARKLIELGAGVVLLDVNGPAARDAATALNAGAGERRSVVVEGSVAVAEDVEAALDAGETAFGPPQLLVNNAGIARLALIVDCDEEQWDATFGVHMKGTFLCTRAFARGLQDIGLPGAVVNLSSVNYEAATEGAADYCAAKAAISQFTKVAALELAPHGIRVNAIAPGGTLTPMAEAHARMREEFVARTPLGRFGEVADIADAAAFLLSEEARWITGVTLAVDGGLHIRGVHNFHAVLTEGPDTRAPPSGA
jgi:NAD(P)-dependent dehydrogenase (short-subunit alcohol dehydrogenase family)